jgi:hypothetical protein
LITATLLLTWNISDFPIHLLVFLRDLGFGRDYVWPSQTENWLRSDFDAWVACNLPARVAEWMGCPICQSWHFSLWAAALLAHTMGEFFVYWLCAPFLANLWMTLYHRMHG